MQEDVSQGQVKPDLRAVLGYIHSRISSYNVTILSYKFAEYIAKFLPKRTVVYISELVSPFFYLILTNKRKNITTNLKQVLQDPSPVKLQLYAERAFVSYARYWIEVFRLTSMGSVEIENSVVAQGLEYIDLALKDGNGAILALPHLGNWDIAGAWLAQRGYPIVAVVEELKPIEVFDWFTKRRNSMNIDVVALNKQTGVEVIKKLRSNHVVALVSDRDLSNSGVEVDFFGKKQRLPVGAATLALRTKAHLLPSAIFSTSDTKNKMIIGKSLDLTRRGDFSSDATRLTQELAWEFETIIRKAPQQWHMFNIDRNSN